MPLTAAACTKEKNQQNKSQSEGIVIGIRSKGLSLDPHAVNDAASFRLIENMYSTLFRYTKVYGEIQPHLIKSHEFSEDGKTLKLNLKQGTKFHSGRELTSEDVVFSINRIISKKVRSGHFDGLESATAHSPYQVILQFKKPNAAILSNLAHPMNAIVDKQATESKDGKLSNFDAGSGPYQLQEWKEGFYLKLMAFDDYFIEGLPKIKQLTYRPIPDESTRIVALKNQEVDLILDVPEKEIDRLKKQENLEHASEVGTFWEYVGLNTKKSPLHDKRVRQAIAYAIDRAEINQLVKQGHAFPTPGTPMPPSHWAANTDFKPYQKPDLEKAKSLLKDAGLESGFKLEMILKGDSPNQIEAAQVVKQQLKKIGVDVQLQPLESTLYFKRLGDRDFQSTLIGWVGFVDPDEWFYHIFHTQGKWNQQNYSNKTVDEKLEQARQELNQERRASLYKEVQELLIEDSPMAFVYLNNLTSAWNSRLEGYVVHPTASTIFLRDANLAN